MYIYKITNKINNKVYIGQSVNPIDDRFHRHIQDALSERADTHFARAIRLYGPENFYTELLQDDAKTPEELTLQEHNWVEYYDSIKTGYNEMDPLYRSGGNTYQSKTPEEMEIIKEKIRQTKLGGKNPNAKGIKCRNENTGEVLHFTSMAECRDYFGQSNHQFISRRCLGTIQSLWNQTWNFCYEDEDFKELAKEKKLKRSTNIHVLNLKTKEEKDFPSYASAERYFGEKNKLFSGHAHRHKENKNFIVNNKYYITILD